MTERNWVIRYESWESYNAETYEEAVKMFKEQFGDSAQILELE